jgi:hypothetical protein
MKKDHMKIIILVFCLIPSLASASMKDTIYGQCVSKMNLRNKGDSSGFCSCFSNYVTDKSKNFSDVDDQQNNYIYKEAASNCAQKVKKSQPQGNSGWNDNMKQSMIKKCEIDAQTNKIVKTLSISQKSLYCECYVAKVTKTINLSEIKTLSQDQLMDKLAPSVIECKKKAANVLF